MLEMFDRKTIKNDIFGELGLFVEPNGKLWFLGVQVAGMLGYKNTRDALGRHVPASEREKILLLESDVAILLDSIPKNPDIMDWGIRSTVVNIDFVMPIRPIDTPKVENHDFCSENTNTQRRKYIIITEVGVNYLIGSSRTVYAEHFRDWLYRDVLPSIRTTGQYIDSAEQMRTKMGNLFDSRTQEPKVLIRDRSSVERERGMDARKLFSTGLAAVGYSPRDFAKITNDIYLAIFGYTANQMKDILGVSHNKSLRDYLEINALTYLTAIEDSIRNIMMGVMYEDKVNEAISNYLVSIQNGSIYHCERTQNAWLPFIDEDNKELFNKYFKNIKKN